MPERQREVVLFALSLNDIAVAVLGLQADKHRTHVLTYRGKPLRTANRRAWRGALKACGIKDFR